MSTASSGEESGLTDPYDDMLLEAGPRLSSDDFGTGHSSLSRLAQLTVSTLKIDHSFIRDIPGDTVAATLDTSIIQLAHSLGLAVVAEGAETPDVIRRLTELGCDMGQGYAFSRPLEADALADWARVHGVAPREQPKLRAA